MAIKNDEMMDISNKAIVAEVSLKTFNNNKKQKPNNCNYSYL